MNILPFQRNLPPAGQAGGGPRPALEAVAEQFEALFLQQILKQMRKAGDVLSAGGPMRSRDLDTLRDFHDQLLADSLSQHRQGGIAELLVQQLSGGAAAESLAGRPPPPPPAAGGGFAVPLQRSWANVVQQAGSLWQRGSEVFERLVERVIAQESGGRVDAVSAKGARGLMQLMPDTAREMAGKLGLEYDEARLTSDAAYNRRLGSHYLEQLLARYDGHQALALAAYNAGPARVDEWLGRHGDPRRGEIDSATWVERIPFAETRDYTRSILGASSPASSSAALPAAGGTLKSAAAGVALLNQDPLAGGLPPPRSAAFAQPLRIEPQERPS